ncbi:farnesol dehydrogenase [Teleopsis dalmanni]|uniref:farnesol dehydrogenase n=1 Tax=Teleopsis dalmanni TaxID=139649 RepID=UPI0018CFB670|nr:farnesol dehydrogenase [Teleopsis dalmanni]
MQRWKNKVAVVTGASNGIGAACAQALVQAGLTVVGLARRQDRIINLKEELPESTKSNLHAIKCDVSVEESVLEAFKSVKDKFGGVDILINNAGIIATTQLSQTDNTKEIRQTVDTNIMGTVYCTRESFESMKERNASGHVIIINSVAGLQVPNLGPQLPSLNIYPATKFALRAMNEIYRQEFQRDNTKVRISTISPGIVDTDILPPNIQSIVKGNCPMLRSSDVAETMLWILNTPPNVQVQNVTIKPMDEKF